MKWWVWFAVGAVLAMSEAARRVLATGYSKGQPVPLELQDIGGGYQLSRIAAPNFLAMRAAAAAEGVFLEVNDAFRSMAQQEDRKNKYGDRAARPGYSNHQLGLAVDLDVIEDATGQWKPSHYWLEANAHRFGFSRTVATEPWHWEYTEPWALEGLVA